MLCPVCNGMEPIQLECSACSNAMEDGGKLTDRFGPYAPYVPHELIEMPLSLRSGESRGTCAHIASCPSCGSWQEIQIAVIE